MAIPDYQSVMLPLLQHYADGADHSFRGSIDSLADTFKLTSSERTQLLPSGQQAIFDNRVGWSNTYLVKAGCLERTRRGYCQITPRGKDLLAENPDRIDAKYLERFEEFIAFRDISRPRTADDRAQTESSGERTPEEALEEAYQQISDNLVQELLSRVLACSPAFFERLVVDLLVKMGYGGSRKDAGEAIGRAGDEGIDGIIREDRLGLDIIYIQAKRWQNSVGRPAVQRFVGALQGQRASKGVMITTSSFSSDAKQYAGSIESKVILIDGTTLARFMIDFDIGVSTTWSYHVKRVDSDYFSDE